MEELISVIVPAYNAGKFISKCICSILKQTYTNFELLIIDDGSEDNTAAICAHYAQRDARIRYVFQENAGVSAARNHGLRLASGQYIAFVDADDWVDTRYLEELYMAMQGHALAVCGHFIQSIKGIKRIVEPELHHIKDIKAFWNHGKTKAKGDTIYTTSINGSVWKCLFRKSLILSNNLRFNEDIFFAEDLLFMLQYLSVVGFHDIIYIDKALYIYFQSADSATRKRYKINLLDNTIVLNAELERLVMGANINYEEKRVIVAMLNYINAYYVISNENNRVRGRHLTEALRELGRTRLLDMVNKSAIKQALYDGKLKVGLILLLFKHRCYMAISFLYQFKR